MQVEIIILQLGINYSQKNLNNMLFKKIQLEDEWAFLKKNQYNYYW